MNVISNPYLIIFLAFFALILVGWIETYIQYTKIIKKREYVNNFRSLFIEWCNSNFSSQEVYLTVLSQSPKAQSLMGRWGVMSYQPPFQNFMYNNWQIILNCIPLINQYVNGGISHSQIHSHVNIADEALIRRLGDFDNQLEEIRTVLINPINLLNRGISFIITIPILLLLEFGILTTNTYKWIINSVLIKLVSFIIAFIGLVSAIVTIVLGWDQFKIFINEYIKNIHS